MDYLYSQNATSTPLPTSFSNPKTLLALLNPYSHLLETLIMASLYQKLVHGSYLYVKGFPYSKKAKASGYPPKTVGIHIILSALVVARYYSLLVFTPTHAPISTTLDFTLHMLQVLSGWCMIVQTPTKSTLYKASFQTMIALIGLAMVLAYTTGDPAWYRTAVRSVEWFIWFRWTIVLMTKYKICDYPKVPKDALVHLVSVPFTLAVADWSSAICAWMIVTPVVMKIDEWVTKKVPDNRAKRSLLMSVLISLSLCEYATNKPPKAEEPVAN